MTDKSDSQHDGNHSFSYGRIYITMGKFKETGKIKKTELRKISRAAAAVKVRARDFLVKVNPGP